MSWTVSGNTVLMEGKVLATLPYNISQTREVDGTVVLILDIPKGATYPRNAFGLILESGTLWQVEQWYPTPSEGTPSEGLRVNGISPSAPPGCVRLFTWVGITLCVDLLTGLVISKLEAK